MKIKKLASSDTDFPEQLKTIHSAPKRLFYLGEPLLGLSPAVAIVGSRKPTVYGKEVTKQLAGELARVGVTVISGLALGIDATAHRAALEAGGRTIAVLGNGLDEIYPATHRNLAKDILSNDGTIVSEYDVGTPALPQHFPARNRIVSALSDGVLITEAAVKSGTLITANFALEQGRTVMAVPGNITSPMSEGTNNLIKTGAAPVANAQDVLHALGLEAQTLKKDETAAYSPEEAAIIELLSEGITDNDELLVKSELETGLFNQTMTMLEISGRIKERGDPRVYQGVYLKGLVCLQTRV